MLQVFHKYQKSVLFILFALVISLAMLFFGLNPYGGNSGNRFAMKINGQEISQNEFFQAKQNVEQRYRSQFGTYYQRFIEQLNINITQQTIDSLIPQVLLQQFAKKQDLRVSNRAIEEAVLGIFGENFSTEAYQGFLTNSGQTAASFEARLNNELLPSTLQDIVKNYVIPSRAEALAILMKENSKASVQSAKFKKADFVQKVTIPADEELEIYFENQADLYEEAATTKYNYLVLDPAKNLDLVDVQPEDIELYYADNIEKYKYPEQVKITEAVVKLTTDTASIISEIAVGTDFASAVKSELLSPVDVVKSNWKGKEDLNKELADAAFSTESIGKVEVIPTEGGQIIYRVEGKREAGQDELSDVSAEIKKTLQANDAPSYVKVLAEDIYTLWADGDQTLEKTADGKGTYSVGPKAMTATDIISPELKNLNELVIDSSDEAKQIHEVGDLMVLVELKEFAPAKIPDFSKVKERVIADYKQEKSAELAEAAAGDFLAGLKLEDDFKTTAEAQSAEFTEKNNTEFASRDSSLALPEVHDLVFSAKSAQILDQVYNQGEDFLVVKVAARDFPKTAELEDKVASKLLSLKQTQTNELISSIIARLKSQAEIEIAPSLT